LRKSFFFITYSACKCAALLKKHNESIFQVSIGFFVLNITIFFSADGNFEVTLATKATLYNTGNHIPSLLGKYFK